jgi:gas vesicle protein
MRHHNSGAAFGAFFAGALIGGCVALLFAPRSGAETRGMIRDFVDDEVDMVKDKAAAARDYVEDEIDRYKRRARRAVRQAEDYIENTRDRIEDELDDTRKVAGY